jgi:hypothetical protein
MQSGKENSFELASFINHHHQQQQQHHHQYYYLHCVHRTGQLSLNPDELVWLSQP